jgi:hypothetical protein
MFKIVSDSPFRTKRLPQRSGQIRSTQRAIAAGTKKTFAGKLKSSVVHSKSKNH